MAALPATTVLVRPYFSASFGAAAAAQGEASGTSHYKQAILVISGLTGETISVTGKLLNSSVYTGKLRPLDLTTLAAASSSDLGNGTYLFDNLIVDTLKFTKSATSETPVLTLVLKSTDHFST